MEHRGAHSWLRQQWRAFKKGPPGERFKKLYVGSFESSVKT